MQSPKAESTPSRFASHFAPVVVGRTIAGRDETSQCHGSSFLTVSRASRCMKTVYHGDAEWSKHRFNQGRLGDGCRILMMMSLFIRQSYTHKREGCCSFLRPDLSGERFMCLSTFASLILVALKFVRFLLSASAHTNKFQVETLLPPSLFACVLKHRASFICAYCSVANQEHCFCPNSRGLSAASTHVLVGK